MTVILAPLEGPDTRTNAQIPDFHVRAPRGSSRQMKRDAPRVVSFRKAVPVHAALKELWRLKPGSLAPPARIHEIRQDAAFRRLLDTCRDAYPVADGRSLDKALVEALQSLGIPAWLPTKLDHLALSPRDVAERLHAALHAKEIRCLHLAPLDLAFDLPRFSFGPARVCRPKPEELAELLDLPRLKRSFGRDQEFGVTELSNFQWLIVEETGSVDRPPGYRSDPFLRLTGPDGTFRVEDHSPKARKRIRPHRSRFPKAFEDALFLLLLFPWEDWTSDSVTGRGFSVPWVHSVDNDLFSPPRLPPPPDSLTWGEQLLTDESAVEHWVNLPVRPGTLDGRADCLTDLKDEDWSRVMKARESVLFETPIVHFLVRGFDSDGIDEFLAHITTVEAALGHPDDRRTGGSTKNLGKRIGNLLGDAGCGERFKCLFDIRCEFVHGRGGMTDISSEDRRMARSLARRVVCALIRRTSTTGTGSREDFLKDLARADAGASG